MTNNEQTATGVINVLIRSIFWTLKFYKVVYRRA